MYHVFTNKKKKTTFVDFENQQVLHNNISFRKKTPNRIDQIDPHMTELVRVGSSFFGQC